MAVEPTGVRVQAAALGFREGVTVVVGWNPGIVHRPTAAERTVNTLYSNLPLALLMGVAPADALEVGSLLGVKTALNEFLAYQDLAGQIAAGAISQRSAVIASYGLCGFANFGSLAILIGGMGGMAPSRRGEIAELGMRSIAAGTFASAMTGCVAGIFL